jgi:hypothetical protein
MQAVVALVAALIAAILVWTRMISRQDTPPGSAMNAAAVVAGNQGLALCAEGRRKP